MENLNKLQEIYENLYYVENKNWSCELDGENIPLGITLEILDLRDIDENVSDEDLCPYSIQVGIVPQNPDVDYWEGDEDYTEDCKLSLIGDMYGYRGSCAYISDPDLTDKFNLTEATRRSFKDTHTGETKYYLTFSEDALNKALDAYISDVSLKMSLIGFILDQPVNLIGTTGWDELEKAIKKD